MLRRLERFSFHFYQPFFSEFRILRKLKSTYFGFRIISGVTCCTKTMLFCSRPAKFIPSHASTNNFEFPALSLLVNSDVTNSIVRQPSDNFAERFTIIKDHKVQFLTSNISARLRSITLKLQTMSI